MWCRKYIWNNSYLNCGWRSKWRMIIAVNFQIKQLEWRSLKKSGLPVEALSFFRLHSNCLNWKFTAMIILHSDNMCWRTIAHSNVLLVIYDNSMIYKKQSVPVIAPLTWRFEIRKRAAGGGGSRVKHKEPEMEGLGSEMEGLHGAWNGGSEANGLPDTCFTCTFLALNISLV